jgi:hypothetical protein
MILASTIYQECLATYHTTCMPEWQERIHIEYSGHYTHHLVVDEEYWHAQTESFRKAIISYLFGFINGWERCHNHTLLTPEMTDEMEQEYDEYHRSQLVVPNSLWNRVKQYFRR